MNFDLCKEETFKKKNNDILEELGKISNKEKGNMDWNLPNYGENMKIIENELENLKKKMKNPQKVDSMINKFLIFDEREKDILYKKLIK